MSFDTRFPGQQIFIADNPENIVFGTAMLGNVFGTVDSLSIVRDGSVVEIEAGASILAVIIKNPKVTLKMDVLFPDDKTAPGLAEQIVFPFAEITGRVMPPVEIKWSKDGHRMLSITGTSWDGFTTNAGAGGASSFDGTTFTDLDD